MKTFVRLLTLLLALLMLAMTVVACDDNGDGGDTDRTANADEFAREGDDLDQYNLNYMGEEINVLYWEDVENPEFDVQQITADNVLMALYDRNHEVMRRMNVVLNFIPLPGHVNHMESFVGKVSADKNSGGHAYDIIAAYARTEGRLSTAGLLTEINSIDESYINLEKPWWPDLLVETATIGDNLYYISGDISTNVLHMMQVTYFNKDIVSSYWDAYATQQGVEPEKDSKGRNVVSPAAQMMYNWGYEGTWTIDKLIMMTQGPDGTGVGNIAGGNVANAKDHMDSYGFSSISYQIDYFYIGCNLRLVESTTDGSLLRISDDYGSMKTVKLVQKLGDWFATDTCWVTGTLGGDQPYTKPWANGQSMFIAVRAHSAKGYDTFDYGVMPAPKWDDTQVNYYTLLGNPISLYGIYNGLDPRENKDETLSMMTAVLECWASETYRLVTPQVFEVNMQLKYADTQCETDMFEIIRSSIVFDIARFYSSDLLGMPSLPGIAAINGASWSSTYAAYKAPLQKKLEIVVSSVVTG